MTILSTHLIEMSTHVVPNVLAGEYSNMDYCVYLTTYRGNKLPMFYIGSASIDKINCGYNGSVASAEYRELWQQERKDRPHLFKTVVISTHRTRDEAYQKEGKLHTALNVAASPMYINRTIARYNGTAPQQFSPASNSRPSTKLSTTNMDINKIVSMADNMIPELQQQVTRLTTELESARGLLQYLQKYQQCHKPVKKKQTPALPVVNVIDIENEYNRKLQEACAMRNVIVAANVKRQEPIPDLDTSAANKLTQQLRAAFMRLPANTKQLYTVQFKEVVSQIDQWADCDDEAEAELFLAAIRAKRSAQ
jgi:hypothetical protein